jgi:hypothetical protein
MEREKTSAENTEWKNLLFAVVWRNRGRERFIRGNALSRLGLLSRKVDLLSWPRSLFKVSEFTDE